MALFQPDRYFSRISAIDISADIVGEGITQVLLDVDNTLLSRADSLVPPDVARWLAHLRQAQVAACLLSNNFHRSVIDLAEELDLPIVAKALKPLPLGFLRALRRTRAPRSETLMIGDQISTDIIGAHMVGLRAYLVCPLAEEDLRHTVLIRNIERAFISDKEPEGASVCETLHS